MAQAVVAFPDRAPLGQRYQPLVVVFVAAAAGVISDRFVPLPILVWVAIGVCLGCSWLLSFLLGRYRVAACCLLLSVAALAAAWHHGRWYLFSRHDLGLAARAEADPVCVRGVVVSGPRRLPALQPDPLQAVEQGDQTRLVLEIIAVRNGDAWQPAAGRSWAIIDGHLLGITAGDTVQVFGQLVAPSSAANPGDFDSAAYHRRQRRLSLLRVEFPDGVTRLQSGWALSPWRLIERLRRHFERQLRRYLSDSESPLGMAILLGAREQLDHDEKDAFLTTGTIHLMAISGLHVSILVSLFLLLARVGVMPNGWAMAIAMAFTLLYALVADPRPPVVRATILTWMMCIAWWMGREAFSLNTLAAAAIAVLLINPGDLFNVGAQLSFLAVGTLAWFAPMLTRHRSGDPLQRLVSEARPWPARAARRIGRWSWRLALASLLVWLIAAPLVAHQFHVFSPIAVVLTPLLWIPVTLLLYSGFGVLLFGWLFPPAATVCGWMCDAMLELLIRGVHLAREIPGGHHWVAGPPLWWILGFYGWLIFLVVCPSWRPRRRWSLLVVGLWLALYASLPWLQAYPWNRGGQRLACTFVSVGHGTGVLLELPGGRTGLYDAGGLGSPRAAARSISASLWSRGIHRLDFVLLSHADTDHYDALPRLMDRFSIGAVYMSPTMLAGGDPAVEHLLDEIHRAQVPIVPIRARDRLPTGGPARLDVLLPPAGGFDDGDNANSVVLLVEFADRRILLPGDLDAAGLDALLAQPPLACDVVMAPHHGRSTGNIAGFLDWSSPTWTVVSGGLGDDVQHLAAQFQGDRRRVLHTARCGEVQIVIDQGKIRVRTWRAGEECSDDAVRGEVNQGEGDDDRGR